MKQIVLLGLLLMISTCLYTSDYFTKKGVNVRDGILDDAGTPNLNIGTQCNEVDLSSDPYNHNGTVMSGYLNVNKGGSALAFIFYGRENTPRADLSKYPVIIWLNGGPGSSSQLGNFMELGPYYVNPAHMAPYEIVKNENSWVQDYNVVFVDQPVGTGLSYADPSFDKAYCTSMEEVATDFYAALKELYQNNNGCFKQLNISPSQDLIIFG
jgi:vitellogenic carboxypeptidase-like protein